MHAGAFPGGSVVKNAADMQVWSLGWEDPLEEEMATHSSILAWSIPWTEEPGGLPTIHRVAKVGHNWATKLTQWVQSYQEKPERGTRPFKCFVQEGDTGDVVRELHAQPEVSTEPVPCEKSKSLHPGTYSWGSHPDRETSRGPAPQHPRTWLWDSSHAHPYLFLRWVPLRLWRLGEEDGGIQAGEIDLFFFFFWENLQIVSESAGHMGLPQ